MPGSLPDPQRGEPQLHKLSLCPLLGGFRPQAPVLPSGTTAETSALLPPATSRFEKERRPKRKCRGEGGARASLSSTLPLPSVFQRGEEARALDSPHSTASAGLMEQKRRLRGGRVFESRNLSGSGNRGPSTGLETCSVSVFEPQHTESNFPVDPSLGSFSLLEMVCWPRPAEQRMGRHSMTQP